MPSQSDALASAREEGRSRYKGLALTATLCAASAIYLLLLNAHDPKLATIEAERTASLALERIGYSWAQVRVENGVAHISGEAPGEPERVLAYETVYKALRPAMTKTMTITRVASNLTLPSFMVAGSDAPPPDANFGRSVATGPKPPHLRKLAQRVPSGTTWYSGTGPALAKVPSEATVYEQVAVAAVPSTKEVAPTTEVRPEHETAAAITAPAALPEPAPAPQSQIITAAIDKPALIATVDCKAEFSAVLKRAHIAFMSTSSRLSKESAGTLDKIAAAAKRCESFSIAVEGHTDGYGSKGYNLSLSRQRAEAVRQALVSRGVKASQVTAKGLGAQKLLTRQAAASARNRRIEFVVSEATQASSNKN